MPKEPKDTSDKNEGSAKPPAKAAKRGRVTEAKRSRVTPSAPQKAPPSPTWYTGLVLGSFAVGVLIIIGNYISGSASNVLLMVGLALILVGFVLAMRLR